MAAIQLKPSKPENIHNKISLSEFIKQKNFPSYQIRGFPDAEIFLSKYKNYDWTEIFSDIEDFDGESMEIIIKASHLLPTEMKMAKLLFKKSMYTLGLAASLLIYFKNFNPRSDNLNLMYVLNYLFHMYTHHNLFKFRRFNSDRFNKNIIVDDQMILKTIMPAIIKSKIPEIMMGNLNMIVGAWYVRCHYTYWQWHVLLDLANMDTICGQFIPLCKCISPYTKTDTIREIFYHIIKLTDEMTYDLGIFANEINFDTLSMEDISLFFKIIFHEHKTKERRFILHNLSCLCEALPVNRKHFVRYLIILAKIIIPYSGSESSESYDFALQFRPHRRRTCTKIKSNL